jgi:hypothetical protein
MRRERELELAWKTVSNIKWCYLGESGNQDLKWPYLAEILDAVAEIFVIISATLFVFATGRKIRVSVVQFHPRHIKFIIFPILAIRLCPPERELPLANPMGKLDAGQCNGRTPERLKTSHRGASAFGRSMSLLNKIVKVLAGRYRNFGSLKQL